MGTTTTINERSRVSLSLGAAWSLVGGLVSVVLAIGYAASEMKQMRHHHAEYGPQPDQLALLCDARNRDRAMIDNVLNTGPRLLAMTLLLWFLRGCGRRPLRGPHG